MSVARAHRSVGLEEEKGGEKEDEGNEDSEGRERGVLWHHLPYARFRDARLKDENVGDGLQVEWGLEVRVELQERLDLGVS